MIKRNILNDLLKHLEKPEITFIVGPRQAGKTTIMKILEDHLKKKGEKTIFLNLDIESDKEHLSSQISLLKKIELEFGKERGFVFIDEIQRKDDAGIFLKGIYDMGLPHKFIVSGSGSVELKEKIHDSLAGRKRIFTLLTLNFEEFFNYKTNYKYENKIDEYFDIEREKAMKIFYEYLEFGGYPKVVLEDTLSEKFNVINEIYQSYIEKDISYLLRIQKLNEYGKLIKIFADSIGKNINFNEVQSIIGLNYKTLKNYLWYLEKTFIISQITPFFRNIRKELSKSPIFYFNDLGLRNFSIGEFGKVRDYSFLFQNFIFLILIDKLKNSPYRIHYWRTKDKAEVDFVVDFGKEIIPIEVKFKNLKEIEITRSLRNFIEKYKPKYVFIVNLSYFQTQKINSTEIISIPFYKFIKFDLLNLI